MSINFNIQSQIHNDIDTIEHLILLNPLVTVQDYYIQNAIFTKIMICLRDLIEKSKRFSKPLTFTDDVIITKDVKNVADLIKFIRDALCHIDSDNHTIHKNTFSYNILRGKIKNAILIDDISISSDYEDDICILFGVQKIYYKRHILRAFKECKANLMPLL